MHYMHILCIPIQLFDSILLCFLQTNGEERGNVSLKMQTRKKNNLQFINVKTYH